MSDDAVIKTNTPLKATTYEMVEINRMPFAEPDQILLGENNEMPLDLPPPLHLVAMNGKLFCLKNL